MTQIQRNRWPFNAAGMQTQERAANIYRWFRAAFLEICIGYFALCWIIWIVGLRFYIPRPPKVFKPVLQLVCC